MTVIYIEPLYGFDANLAHIAVGESNAARKTLLEMGNRLAGAEDLLIAIYIPESTAPAYGVSDQAGKVVGAVRLLPMPGGYSIDDYFHIDFDGTKRWPCGWPCEVVFAPRTEDCRFLRYIVDDLLHVHDFGSYAAQFQTGPFKLDWRMRKYLTTYFNQFKRLR
jgi:hypothetical protein